MSTLLYRSPNVIVDAHEWHVAAKLHRGNRITIGYYWRPLGAVRGDWKSLVKWQGPRPKQFARQFQRYRPHALVARDTERQRQEAVARIKQLPATVAMRANAA